MSAVIAPGGFAAQAFDHVFLSSTVITSVETERELYEVLSRRKFDRYLPLQRRLDFFRDYLVNARRFEPAEVFNECIDPKDDKFLNLALSGRADLILSGDTHLLRMNPWRGIPILTPREFLERNA